MGDVSEYGDIELMLLFQKGNAHAFELLYEKYRVALFNFIYRMLGDHREAAEDLLQEIFVKIAGSRDVYEPRAKFSTWLFAIARNHCINHLRSRRYLEGQATVSLDIADNGLEGASLADLIHEEAFALDTVERNELATLLDTCIRQLPDAYKEVFLLRRRSLTDRTSGDDGNAYPGRAFRVAAAARYRSGFVQD